MRRLAVTQRMAEPLRIAILDTDSGFVQVLAKRADDMGWQYRRLESPPRTEEVVAMRVNALVVDLSVLRERLGSSSSSRSPCPAWASSSAPVARAWPSVARAATGRRRLGDQAVPPRGGAGAGRGRGPAPQARLRQGRRRAARGGRDGDPDQFQAFAAGRSVDLTRREFECSSSWPRRRARSYSARRSTSRSGATRWLTATAPSTSSSGRCGRSWRRRHPTGSTSALRRGLPLRAGVASWSRRGLAAPAEVPRSRRPERTVH